MVDDQLYFWDKVRKNEIAKLEKIISNRLKIVDSIKDFYIKRYHGDGIIGNMGCIEINDNRTEKSASRGYVVVNPEIQRDLALMLAREKHKLLGIDRMMVFNEISCIPPEEYKHTGFTAFYWENLLNRNRIISYFEHYGNNGLFYRVISKPKIKINSFLKSKKLVLS